MFELDEFNAESIIAKLYIETSSAKFDSYKNYLLFKKKYKMFYEKLSQDLRKEFDALMDVYNEYEDESVIECCKFCVKSYKKLIGIEK